MLRASSHDVEVTSQGEVAEWRYKFYPAFREPEPFHPDVPVYYASALPIRKIKPLWGSLRTLQLFKSRHRAKPFDVAIIWNLQHPQLVCARYAIRKLKIPVILEYEDDAFVDIWGQPTRNSMGHHAFAKWVLENVSGCMACSPWLLSQAPAKVPKLLLRGVIGADIISLGGQSVPLKKNRVLFSGTHYRQYGIPSLIEGWKQAGLSDWELHITGQGPDTAMLKQLAAGVPGVHFHGMVSREELVRLMCSAKICVNPHDVSHVQGNLFAFKIIEYLAAGAHVISTPMGKVEEDLERGMTYMPDNKPETIAATLKQVVQAGRWDQSAAQFARDAYGPEAVTKSLNALVNQVAKAGTEI